MNKYQFFLEMKKNQLVRLFQFPDENSRTGINDPLFLLTPEFFLILLQFRIYLLQFIHIVYHRDIFSMIKFQALQTDGRYFYFLLGQEVFRTSKPYWVSDIHFASKKRLCSKTSLQL